MVRQTVTRAAGTGSDQARDAGGHGAAPREEADLLARIRRGEEAACAILVKRYGPAVLAAARRILRDEHDAQDAAQEAFLAAFRAALRFKGGSRLGTWLHRIAVNAALMQLRRRRSRPEGAIEDMLPRFLEDGHHARPPLAWQESAEALLERREARGFVRRCIDRLPEGYRTVLVLRDIEELDTRESARALGIEPNAVKVRLHRARQALRGMLAEGFEPPLGRGRGSTGIPSREHPIPAALE